MPNVKWLISLITVQNTKPNKDNLLLMQLCSTCLKN